MQDQMVSDEELTDIDNEQDAWILEEHAYSVITISSDDLEEIMNGSADSIQTEGNIENKT